MKSGYVPVFPNFLSIFAAGLACLILAAGPQTVFALGPPSAFQTDEEGKVIVPLSERETKALTPTFKSVRDFWEHFEEWNKAHPGARLRWFIRHGEATSNIMDFTQFPGIFTPLTWRGRQQAKALAALLERVPFDSYMASHLERAYETLLAVAKKQQKADQVNVDKRLEEVSYWPAGGMPFKESQIVFEELQQQFKTDPEHYATPGHKSFKQFRADLHALLNQLANNEDKNIALGTHGMTVLFTVMEACDVPLKKYWAARKLLKSPPNVSVTLLANDPGSKQWEMLVYSDNSYLPDALKERSSERFVKMQHYILAAGRLLLKQIGKFESEPIDYFPSSATFFAPSPRDVKSALEAAGLMESAA